LDNKVSFEPASWRDLLPVLRLEKICFKKDAWPLTDILEVLIRPGVIRWKAIKGGELVGFVAGELAEGGRVGWIITLGVTPAFRRQGIARVLLDTAEHELGTERIQLVLRKSNHGASTLYTSRGYRLLEIWSAYYSDGEDGLVMEKQVSVSRENPAGVA
jgi:ribosomal protein S18 acetylase RimI-like enzyme